MNEYCQKPFCEWSAENSFIPDKKWRKKDGMGLPDSVQTRAFHEVNIPLIEAVLDAAYFGHIPGIDLRGRYGKPCSEQ